MDYLFEEIKDSEKPESLIFKPNQGLKGVIRVFTGTSEDYYVSISPSLDVSGYGATKKQALRDLKYNLGVFNADLLALTTIQAHKELEQLGWVQKPMFNKRFSKSFIDQKGVLQNFDQPELVEESTYCAA